MSVWKFKKTRVAFYQWLKNIKANAIKSEQNLPWLKSYIRSIQLGSFSAVADANTFTRPSGETGTGGGSNETVLIPGLTFGKCYII